MNKASNVRESLLSQLTKALNFAIEGTPVLADDSELACPEPKFRREKFISETALLLHAASLVRGAPPEIKKKIFELARLIAPYARSDLIMASMKIKPMIASELGVAHACLTRLGLEDQKFQRNLEQILSDPSARFFERLPWKNIEANWFLSYLAQQILIVTLQKLSNMPR